MRWAVPIVLTGVTGWVAWTNTTSPDTRIVFPMLRGILGPDPDVLSWATIAILMVVSIVSVVGAVRDTRRPSGDVDPGQ